MEQKVFEEFATKNCICKQPFASEYGRQFKNNSLSCYRKNFEPPIPHDKLIISKELYDRANTILPTEISFNSTYRRDYGPEFKPQKSSTTTNEMYHGQKLFSTNIDPNSVDYVKYLDIYATLNKLDFRNHVNNKVENDAITIWDWLKVPKTRGQSLEIDIPICKPDFDTSVRFKRSKCNQFVPNRGLLSEQREEFSHESLSGPTF